MGKRDGVFSSFEVSNFRFMWFIIAFTSAGRWAFTLAISWQMYAITQSSFWVGLIIFAMMIPNILGAPVAGVFADIIDRRLLMFLAIILNALVTALLAVVGYAQWLTPVFALFLTFLFGLGSSVLGVAANSLLPNLVSKEMLFNAISLQGVAQRGTEFVGPALASPLLALYGAGSVFVFVSILAVLAAVLVYFIRLERGKGMKPVTRGFFKPLQEGIQYIRRFGVVKNILFLVALHCSLTMAYMGMLPKFVKIELGGTAEFYGTLVSTVGLGAIFGTLLLVGIKDKLWRGRLYWLMGILSGLTLLILGASHSRLWLLVSTFGVGFSQAMFMTIALAFIQEVVDEDIRGRVTGVYAVLAGGIMSLANWLLGSLATVISPHILMMVVGGIFVLVILVYSLVSMNFRLTCRWESGVIPEYNQV